MTATAIVGRILPLTMAAGGIVYFVSIAGAPGWVVGLCTGALGICHALLTWWIVSPREQ